MSDPGDEHNEQVDPTDMGTHQNWDDGMPEDASPLFVGDNDHGDAIPNTTPYEGTIRVPTAMDTYNAINNARNILEIISDPANEVTDYMRKCAKDVLELYPDKWSIGWIVGNHMQWTYHALIVDTDFAKKMEIDPVQFVPEAGGWIFWDNAWAYPSKPYPTYKDAESGLKLYCEELLKTEGKTNGNEV